MNLDGRGLIIFIIGAILLLPTLYQIRKLLEEVNTKSVIGLMLISFILIFGLRIIDSERFFNNFIPQKPKTYENLNITGIYRGEIILPNHYPSKYILEIIPSENTYKGNLKNQVFNEEQTISISIQLEKLIIKLGNYGKGNIIIHKNGRKIELISDENNTNQWIFYKYGK